MRSVDSTLHHHSLLGIPVKAAGDKRTRTNRQNLHSFLNTFIFNVFTSFNLLCSSEVLQAFCSMTMAIRVFLFFLLHYFSSCSPNTSGWRSVECISTSGEAYVHHCECRASQGASNIDLSCASTPVLLAFPSSQKDFLSPCFNKQENPGGFYFITVFLLL